jgi:hypothetical protein
MHENMKVPTSCFISIYRYSEICIGDLKFASVLKTLQFYYNTFSVMYEKVKINGWPNG